MSSINVNLTELNGIKRSLEKSQSKLSKAANRATSVSIDGAIAARRSIGSRITSTNRSIREIENQFSSLISFLGDAVHKYEQTEEVIDKLIRQMEDFREKRSAWDWVVDQAEYIGEKAKDAWKSVDDFLQGTLDLLETYTSTLCGYIDQAVAAVNKWLDQLRDLAIAGGANPIEQYFLTGVLKGLVDTVGGILKLAIEAPWFITKTSLKIEGYVTDVFMSEDPFQKVKDDIMGLPDKAEAVYTGIKQTFSDIKTQFVNADANHKAEMIGFAVEKVVELFIPGVGEAALAKNAAIGAREAAVIAREGLELASKSADDVIIGSTKVADTALEAINAALAKGSQKTWDEFLINNPGRSVEDVSKSYIKLIEEQSPWPEGFDTSLHTSTLKSGDTFHMALDSSQPLTSPGNFATYDEITSVAYVRNNLAVKSDWKQDCSKVVTYRVKEGVEIPVIQGPVGPQIDLNADLYLPGGGTQVQLLLDRGVNKMDYLEIVSVRSIE
ncbi:hypothetical protein [Paenibacillus xylaniclasticus]|uniref:hypothetical protein n=1 Tax=Paenibacillus xylaniclasticus TaxID=588083 RepID=UPI000FD9CAAF|nr:MULTISPECIES: hypothetical protein [Paenibacillus]GFN30967.1 hypothetical protein PCURB6_12270 [Paenibacillus curdlanolyticus]